MGYVLCIAGVIAVAYALTQVLSPRAAYIHIGALFGTIMAANVWVRILPAQRQMVAALKNGTAVDLTLGERAKGRSIHNTFMAFPLIFIMISNHFPVSAYGHAYNWAMLAVFLGIGFLGRRLLNWHEAKPLPKKP